MKQSIFLFLFISGTLASCSNSSEEFETAAKELCSCISESSVDADDAASANMNLGLCLLDAKVDLKAPEMAAEIEKQCPQFKFAFEQFVKELK